MIAPFLCLLFSITLSLITTTTIIEFTERHIGRIKNHFRRELTAHQCGRALSLIKNLKSTAARNLTHDNHLRQLDRNEKSIVDAATFAIENIKKHYENSFEFRDQTCFAKNNGYPIATTYLLNSDEDHPDTGYYSYQLNHIKIDGAI